MIMLLYCVILGVAIGLMPRVMEAWKRYDNRTTQKHDEAFGLFGGVFCTYVFFLGGLILLFEIIDFVKSCGV